VRAPGPIRVVVTIPPLAGLVKPLLPENASVKILMTPGRSEHGYEFTSGDIDRVARADVVMCVSKELEPAVVKFLTDPSDPNRRIVRFDRDTGIGPGVADHGKSPIDPHVWLDPELCIILVNALEPTVLDALTAASDLKGAATVAAKAEELRTKIQAVDDEYKARLGPLKGRSIVTHHNAWGRIADRYGLKVAAVMRDIDEGEMTPRAVAETVAAIKNQGVKAVFIEPQFDRTAAQRIAEQTGVKIATLDPLGDGDWFRMMRANLDSLTEALGP
jgi:ABC-type Zn uptake system ZnuABC Zn-binding protein ZnuA